MSAAEIPQLQTSTDERFPGVRSFAGRLSRLPYGTAPTSTDEMRDAMEGTIAPSAARPSVQVGDPLMTSEEYQRHLHLLLQDLDRVRANALQIEQKLDAQSTKTRQPSSREAPGPLPSADVARDGTPLPGDTPRQAGQGIGPESTGLRLYDPSAPSQSDLFMSPAQAAEVRPSVMTPPVDAPAGSPSLAATLRRVSEYTNRLQTASGDKGATRNDGGPDPSPAEAALPQQMPAAEASQTYENAGSPSRQQFDHCMTVAAMNMLQGRFDRAAESFTLASVYISHDSRAHLGKSHALLAVGDFVASALSLARAVELDAPFALKKVDLVETLGGPDPFVERIANLEELAHGGDAPLQFLLAYVYYQMDRPDEARTAIEAARKGVMSSVAVGRLAAAIGQ